MLIPRLRRASKHSWKCSSPLVSELRQEFVSILKGIGRNPWSQQDEMTYLGILARCGILKSDIAYWESLYFHYGDTPCSLCDSWSTRIILQHLFLSAIEGAPKVEGNGAQTEHHERQGPNAPARAKGTRPGCVFLHPDTLLWPAYSV